jgi:hypothetical protein
MAPATAIQFSVNTSTNRPTASDQMRLRALARLYERREAVGELIESLERYQQRQQRQRAECIAINAVAK